MTELGGEEQPKFGGLNAKQVGPVDDSSPSPNTDNMLEAIVTTLHRMPRRCGLWFRMGRHITKGLEKNLSHL